MVAVVGRVVLVWVGRWIADDGRLMIVGRVIAVMVAIGWWHHQQWQKWKVLDDSVSRKYVHDRSWDGRDDGVNDAGEDGPAGADDDGGAARGTPRSGRADEGRPSLTLDPGTC